MDWKTLLCKERPRKSTSPGDHRAEFERDFDRAIFSTPVKRLQDKAQVFPLEPHDAIRTRLTHSLEVSSVARGLGIAVAKWLREQRMIDENEGRSIEAIAATCGLIHDLGNPPFGHAGEIAIRSWFSRHLKEDLHGIWPWSDHPNGKQLAQDFLLFEGNAQSLRIISKLQILADHNGLNLTYGTLSASCKYIAASHETNEAKGGDHALSKPGYFASENELIEKIRETTGTGRLRNPITFLVEAADDIVYSVADIEDGVKKGILSWQVIKSMLEGLDDETIKQVLINKDRILQAGGADKIGNLPDDIHASAFRTAAITSMVATVVSSFKDNYQLIMKGEYKNELIKDSASCTLVGELKRIGRIHVYCTQPTLKLEILGRKIITDLMSIFWEGVRALPEAGSPATKNFEGKIGSLLSENYRRVYQYYIQRDKSILPREYHRYQLLTDYICGMTDSFAKRLHSELTNGT